MDVTENYPSLINCLETGQNGLFLDLSAPSGGQTDAVRTISCNGPFSKTIPGCIKTDGGGVVKQVLLVLQRDHYDTPGSLLPLNNSAVETAWQNAFAFYRTNPPAQAPIFFKHQINPKGEFEPLQPLFRCRETGHWFHPVCPQCGLALTLCRDDALLEKRGLPSYSESLERLLYCGSCATLSDSSPFFCREKAAGMPDNVHDASALVTQWKQLLAKFPDDTDLPCRACPDRDACYGPDSLVSGRIVPFRFFPFYLMMMPAPSCLAADFIPLISGDTAAAQLGANMDGSPPGPNRFLFQGQERQFLEILYLKLTFLSQVCRQIMPADDPAAMQAFDLSLEGLGIDLNPPGAGLPAYWNFNVRILDAVGAFQASPFSPSMPEAPRLHFLGAVWFRTLLVNSRQPADTVYAEVGRLLRQMDKEKGVETLEIDSSTPLGVFACSQIVWVPDQRILSDNWHLYWDQAMRMGFELVDAGLNTGVAWDHGGFLTALDALRIQIRDAMFSGPAIASTGKEKTAAPDQIKMVLHGILQKWQAETPDGSQPILGAEPETPDVDETIIMSSATKRPTSSSDRGGTSPDDMDTMDKPGMPIEETGWDGDIQETVIFSSAGKEPPSESTLRGVAQPQLHNSQWDDDIGQTIILQTDSTPPIPPPKPGPGDDSQPVAPDPANGDDDISEQTIIIRSDVKKK